MSLPPIPELTVFMGLVLAFALYGLTASGHFPEQHRAPALKRTTGRFILWGSIAGAFVVLVAACVLAFQRLPIYAAVIGGGGMLLIAPLVLQSFPDSFVDGRRGLLSFTAFGLVLVIAARCVMA